LGKDKNKILNSLVFYFLSNQQYLSYILNYLPCIPQSSTMHKSISHCAAISFLLIASACSSPKQIGKPAIVKTNDFQTANLPAPYATGSKRKISNVIGWGDNEKPIAPEGFTVSLFAKELDNPRWIYITKNGDVFVSESASSVDKNIKETGEKVVRKMGEEKNGKSANRISLFRDGDKNGSYESKFTFASNLNQPLGMLILNNHFYVANTDGVEMYPYNIGDTALALEGKRITELPAGGYNNHWTRNIIANEAGTKIYITVGSGSNNGENGMENEIRRANILEINADGSGERIYAAGLRNPVGMDFEPTTKTLWTAVNERDDLGDELVPDYITSVKDSGFYGWPYAYFGSNPDPRMKDDPHLELVSKTIVPDVSLGAHTASLGLTFYNKNSFPEKYRGGVFVGQHGSWNRSQFSGYKVVFVPFANGKPSGLPEDFLTGFIVSPNKNEVRGRPVAVAVMNDGSLLVTDDGADMIWKITAH
jgi:glucose/arabinose dehydrogenase